MNNHGARWIAVLTVGLCTQPSLAIELIENGSFEEFVRRPEMTVYGWDIAWNIGRDRGLFIQEYPYLSGGEYQGGDGGFENPPGLDDSFDGTLGPAGGGRYYGCCWGGGRVGWNTASQFLDVAEYAGRRYSFSAWLASRRDFDDLDHARITLEFFQGPVIGGRSLGLLTFDGNDSFSPFIIGSMNVAGRADPTVPATQDNWTSYRASGTIPLAATAAAVVIHGAVPSGLPGTGRDGYVDLVSLVAVPEPSTVVTLLIAAVACVLRLRSRCRIAWLFPRRRRGQ